MTSPSQSPSVVRPSPASNRPWSLNDSPRLRKFNPAYPGVKPPQYEGWSGRKFSCDGGMPPKPDPLTVISGVSLPSDVPLENVTLVIAGVAVCTERMVAPAEGRALDASPTARPEAAANATL